MVQAIRNSLAVASEGLGQALKQSVSDEEEAASSAGTADTVVAEGETALADAAAGTAGTVVAAGVVPRLMRTAAVQALLASREVTETVEEEAMRPQVWAVPAPVADLLQLESTLL